MNSMLKRMDFRRLLLLSLLILVESQSVLCAQTYVTYYEKMSRRRSSVQEYPRIGLIVKDSAGKKLFDTKAIYERVIALDGCSSFVIETRDVVSTERIFRCYDLKRNLLFTFPSNTKYVNIDPITRCYYFAMGIVGFPEGGEEGAYDQYGNVLFSGIHEKIFPISGYMASADFVTEEVMLLSLYSPNLGYCNDILIHNPFYWPVEALPWIPLSDLTRFCKTFNQWDKIEEDSKYIEQLWKGIVLIGKLDLNEAKTAFEIALSSSSSKIRDAAEMNIVSLNRIRQFLNSEIQSNGDIIQEQLDNNSFESLL